MEEEKMCHRESAPIFTSGFRFGNDNEIAIVDFIDRPADDIMKVIYSVALTKKQASDLIEALSSFVNEE
tara:strand:+ start:415 stop:621 length:207 start_codon:yes stop_codon:yes gene_type:complete